MPVYSPELLAPGQAELTLADLPQLPAAVREVARVVAAAAEREQGAEGQVRFLARLQPLGRAGAGGGGGAGVALVPYGIACQDILKGALRQIDCRSAPFGSGYRFLANPHKENMPKVQRFRAWIEARDGRHAAPLEQL